MTDCINATDICVYYHVTSLDDSSQVIFNNWECHSLESSNCTDAFNYRKYYSDENTIEGVKYLNCSEFIGIGTLEAPCLTHNDCNPDLYCLNRVGYTTYDYD